MMLLSEALAHLVYLWDNGPLASLPHRLVHHRIPLVLVQVLNKTLHSREPDSHWLTRLPLEEIAYSVLTLAATASLPWPKSVQEEISIAIRDGRRVLSQSSHSWAQAPYLWIEKVSYGSSILSQGYCLAAMKTTKATHPWSKKMEALLTDSSETVPNLSKIFSRIKTLSEQPIWRLESSIMEGLLFLPQLKTVRSEIFPRHSNTKDDYLPYIPCIWTVINHCSGLFQSATILLDMMVVSLLDFLVDEYMESVVARCNSDDLDQVEQFVSVACQGFELRSSKSLKHLLPENELVWDGCATLTSPKVTQCSRDLIRIKTTLSRYVEFILSHPRIRDASTFDRNRLQKELQSFLASHIIQIRDNIRFSQQTTASDGSIAVFHIPRSSFYSWTHTTASKHISAPFSFAFYTCLIGSTLGNGDSCFLSARQDYLAQDLSLHLAVMSRLYNDYASVPRDRAEKNLNSVNFPEHHQGAIAGSSGLPVNEDTLKAGIWIVPQFSDEMDRLGTLSGQWAERPDLLSLHKASIHKRVVNKCSS